MDRVAFLTLIFLISQNLGTLKAAHVRNEAPIVRIFETVPPSEEERLVEKPPNSNLIVGEDVRSQGKLILECEARYPVQWIYSGDGMPEYSTNTSKAHTSGGITRPDKWFSASMALGFQRPLTTLDSGRYTCRSVQNQDLSVFYDLFVSNGKLFINSRDDTIYYNRKDERLRIPCSVSNPNATVSLHKVIDGRVRCVNQSVSYDQNRGYEMRRSQITPGTYLCMAILNDTFEVVRYTLVEDVEFEKEQPEPITSSQSRQCSTNSDCSSVQSCLKGKCDSPCNSLCGRNTRCDVVNHVASCRCLAGHAGDPYKGCYRTGGLVVEKDPCVPTPCGLNTICERENGVARCSCAPGFEGNPYTSCYHVVQRNPCSPNPCGPNGVCQHSNGFTSCKCRNGFFGTPPHCRPECDVPSDCPNDRTCLYGRCRNPCEGACANYRKTECRVIHRQPVCATINCPSGYYGRDCLSLYTREDDGSISIPEKVRFGAISWGSPSVSPCSPFPCGLNAECSVKSEFNSVLNTTIDVGLCQCPPGSTGNADIECYKIEENSETGIKNQTTISPDCECGINANCTESNVCMCPPKYRGNPKVKCYPIYCNTSSDCDNVNAFCVTGKCHDEREFRTDDVEANCGENATTMNVEGTIVCACPESFTGIPTLACHPITVNSSTPSFEQANQTHIANTTNCTIPQDCQKGYICHNSTQTCINPCDMEYQAFFEINVHCQTMEKPTDPSHNATCVDATRTKCGPNSGCKRFHDEERCVCAPGFFGDPNDVRGCALGIQCRSSENCGNEEECFLGKCLNVCRHRNLCRPLSGCKAENHKASCICHIGTILNNETGACESAKGALRERLLFFKSVEEM